MTGPCNQTTPERDIEARPYSSDEQRVAEWLCEHTQVGGGDDPIGFLLASVGYLQIQKRALRDALEAVQAEILLTGQLAEIVEDALHV